MLTLHDDGIVENPVEERGGNDGIAEGLTPFGKAAVQLWASDNLPPGYSIRWRRHQGPEQAGGVIRLQFAGAEPR